jgi:hypothetical protein
LSGGNVIFPEGGVVFEDIERSASSGAWEQGGTNQTARREIAGHATPRRLFTGFKSLAFSSITAEGRNQWKNRGRRGRLMSRKRQILVVAILSILPTIAHYATDAA